MDFKKDYEKEDDFHKYQKRNFGILLERRPFLSINKSLDFVLPKNAATLLTVLIHYYLYGLEKEFNGDIHFPHFYISKKELFWESKLSPKYQKEACDILEAYKLITTETKNLNKKYYRLNKVKIMALMYFVHDKRTDFLKKYNYKYIFKYKDVMKFKIELRNIWMDHLSNPQLCPAVIDESEIDSLLLKYIR